MTISVPETEAEVFETYYPHVKYLVSRAGIRRDYVEDYAMILMAKFIEKGVLHHYDPTRETEVGGVKRTANFKTFLSGFVSAYLRYFAKRDAINASRSAISHDLPVGENKDTPLLDYLKITVADETDEIEAQDLVRNVQNALNKRGDQNLSLFFDIVLLQVHEYGKVEVRELAEMFEVSRATIHNWLKKLRVEFEKCQ